MFDESFRVVRCLISSPSCRDLDGDSAPVAHKAVIFAIIMPQTPAIKGSRWSMGYGIFEGDVARRSWKVKL
jgi:hypothetical protein